MLWCFRNDIFFYDSKQKIINDFEWRDKFKLFGVEEALRYNQRELRKLNLLGSHFGCGHEYIIEGDSAFGGSKTYKNAELNSELIKIAIKVKMKKIGAKYSIY